ncbi:MAG: hypothetical protein ACOYKN_21830, partial [Pirellula sp.]
MLFLARPSGNKKRRKELVGLVEPLGFDVLSKFDNKLIADFYHHLPTLGFKINIASVCVADSDSMRIVVMEYHVGKGHFLQYYLGINPSISAPQIVIKKRTPSTKSIWTASWGDVMFHVDLKDDPEFDRKLIVRGDTAQAREFLNPTRRRTLCEASDLPDNFSVYGQSVLFSFANRI